MNEYIGITVGPVFSTMALTNTPAALWAASYMFSYLTANICAELSARGVLDEQFVSPAFSKQQEKTKNGVGQYHDRLIVRVQNGMPDLSLGSDAVEKAKEKLSFLLQTEMDTEEDIARLLLYINRYVRVVAFSFSSKEGESAFAACQKQFDSAELYEPIPDPTDQNPLLRLFDSRGTDAAHSSRNWLIRRSNLLKYEIDAEKWQLYENGMLRTLESIAGVGEEGDCLASDYCVVLRSDGDNMGQMFEQCHSDEDVRAFSAHCIHYCAKISEKIGEYGGATIYAGGDDLLAIVPLLSVKKKKENGRYGSLFDLIYELKEISEMMLYRFCKEKGMLTEGKLTVSFGASIVPHEYPLQRMLEKSSDMLFRVAKGSWDTKSVPKDRTAISYIGIDGRIDEFFMKNEAILQVLSFLDYLHENPDEALLIGYVIKKMMSGENIFLYAQKAGEKALRQVLKTAFFFNYRKKEAFYERLFALLLAFAKPEMETVALDRTGEVVTDSSIGSFLAVFRVIYSLVNKVEVEE